MRFFQVSSQMITEEQVFTIPIFLFDQQRDQRIVALHANSPATKDLKEIWTLIEEKGGYLQIKKEDELVFIREAEITQDDFNKVNSFMLEMIKVQEIRELEFSEKVNEEFVFKDKLQIAIENNNFLEIIQRARMELVLFPLTISREVSMMTFIVEKLFVNETTLSKIASFTYFLAKAFGIKDQESLAQIVLATLFKDVGLTLINTDILKETNKEIDETYKKHPMLSIYLLSKHPVDLSKSVKRIILEQHELIDGTGYPRNKTENFIDIKSQIVQIGDHVIKFADGFVDGKKRDVHQVLKMIINANQTEGLITSFSPSVVDILKSLIVSN